MLRFETAGGPVEVEPVRALIAGWTGRNRDAVEHHIKELAEIGVPRPSAVPLYYRVSAGLLTQVDTIQVVGAATSGEAEPVIIDDGERLWLTLGSDHTDRELEAHSVALSKQVCAKPLADRAWALDAIGDPDVLVLRSSIREDGDWGPYQDGTLETILPLRVLIAGAPGSKNGRLGAGTVMFCGTLPVLSGGVRPASGMRLEILDAATGEAIALEYGTETLDLVS